MPNINIDDAYVLGETGEQVDKVTGLFTKDEDTTSGEKAFAQLNIGTAGCNRNLLDNPFFTVRQRGNGPFSGAGYTVDRWTKFYNGIITGTDNGVSITPSGTSGWIEFAQYLPADVGAALEGKTLTLSALLQDGTLYSKSGVCVAKPSSGTTNFITISMPNSMGFVVGRRNDGALRVEFTYGQAYSQDPLNVCAVKLELGSVSTLANDTPPDYGTEFLKCARYFLRIKRTNSSYPLIGTGITLSTSNAAILIPTPVPMRNTTITVSYSGNFAVLSVGSSGNLVTAMSYYDHTAAGVRINCTLSDSVFTPFYGCMLQGQGSTNGYIDLSADL